MNSQHQGEPSGQPDTKPKRIQRKRTRGWRKPDGAVIVDRSSRFGNPFRVATAIEFGFADVETEARRVCVQRFRDWLNGVDPADPDVVHSGNRQFDRRWILSNLEHLRGRDLCCPCPPDDPCHADELLARANPDDLAGGQQ